MAIRNTTAAEDRDFRETAESSMDFKVTVEGAADWVLEWVSENFTPAEVFGEKALRDWARENGMEDSDAE